MPKPARIPAFARAPEPALQVAHQVIKQRVRAAVQYWQQVAQRDQPRVEDIHQLRVWSRRAIAAVQLFAPFLAPEAATEVTRILNKARKRAGRARDCDVLLKTLDKSARALLRDSLAALREQREAAAVKLRKAYRKHVRSGELREWCQKLQPKSLAGKKVKALPVLEFGPWFQQRLAAVSADFVAQLEPTRLAARRIHSLRIDAKRVRYALEIGLPSLPKQAGERLYAGLEVLQEQLGQICDDQALAQQYRDLAQDLKPGKRVELIAAAERHELGARAGATKFGRWWKAAAGRKRLLQQLTAISTPPAAKRSRVQRRKSE